jgi:murein DD-endopeptidase MepM/ murein hydrolase activator NlpD
MISFSRFSQVLMAVVALSTTAIATHVVVAQAQATGSCQAALSRLVRHKIAAGETLESIAQKYDLIPATLMGMNPVLRNGNTPVGAEIVVPPYNGIRVEVPAGQTIRDIAKTYNVRADVLFEVNGCQTTPKVAFVPGVNWSPNATSSGTGRAAGNPATVLTGYPLPGNATTLLGYGWRLRSTNGTVAFHSGVDLAAKPGTRVLAVADGTVAFAGNRDLYGNMVVINHQQGWQTRYAQLTSLKVKAGQTVRKGTPIGLVGQTGRPSSSDPHLHFELRSNSSLGWVAEDPARYLQSFKTRAQGN